MPKNLELTQPLLRQIVFYKIASSFMLLKKKVKTETNWNYSICKKNDISLSLEEFIVPIFTSTLFEVIFCLWAIHFIYINNSFAEKEIVKGSFTA